MLSLAFFRKVLAHLRLRLVLQGTYLIACVFGFQGSGEAFGEVPPYINPPTQVLKPTKKCKNIYFKVEITKFRKEKAEIIPDGIVSAKFKKANVRLFWWERAGKGMSNVRF
jgi:hypothetical protein